MTIAHSVISLSFGRKGSRNPASESGWRSAEPSTCAAPGGMTCAPWEGLYFPAAEADGSQEETVSNSELELFLSSLMSGE